MKKHMLTTLLLTGSFLVCFAAALNINGKWNTVIKTEDGNEIPLTYNFQTSGDKLTGTVGSSMGEYPLDNGMVKGDSIFFSINYNGNVIPAKGKCYTDSIGLNMKFNDMNFHAQLKPVK